MNLSPAIRQRFFDDVTGAPLAGGFLYSYQAGTSIPQGTFSNSLARPIRIRSSLMPMAIAISG